MTTELIKVDLNAPEKSFDDIKAAAEVIRRGGLVVFPTETVYGLGGNATDALAAKKIYAAKGRPSDNPLIIHVSTPDEAEGYAETGELYYELAKRFMPGPLTVIMNSKQSIPPETRGGLDTVAVRCPENVIARKLIEFAGVPIAAPSANLSGSPSPTTAKHVIDDMEGRVDVIIDGGECDFGLESTIVKIEGDSALTLLRPGKITVEELSHICDVKIADAVVDKLKDGERVLSPGMKYRHYAPTAPLVLLDGELDAQIEYIKADRIDNVGVLAYSENLEHVQEGIKNAKVFDLGSSFDEATQAHRLFSILRDADKFNFDKIYAPLPSKEGVGLALYNRMIRAAAHTIINLKH